MSSSYAKETSFQALSSSSEIRSASRRRWRKFLVVTACPVADALILLNLLHGRDQSPSPNRWKMSYSLNLSIQTTASGEIEAGRLAVDGKVNPTRSAMIPSIQSTISSIVILFSSINYISSAFVPRPEPHRRLTRRTLSPAPAAPTAACAGGTTTSAFSAIVKADSSAPMSSWRCSRQQVRALSIWATSDMHKVHT
jgi:hypothetical protein